MRIRSHRPTRSWAPTRLALIGTLLAAGCNEPQPVQTINQPPQILLEQPQPDPDGEPIPVEQGAGLTFQAVVSDTEDDPDELVIHWIAERTDAGGVESNLGDTTADQTGRTTKVIGALEAGRYVITARVEDSRGATDEVGLPIRVFAENAAPTALVTQPLIGADFIEEDLITFVGTATDDRTVIDLDVEWFSSIDGLLNNSAPISSGLMTFSRDDLSSGDHVVTVRVTDQEGLFGEAQATFTVIPKDSPPTQPTVVISPASPLSTNDLNCLITLGSSDPDGGTITYTYSWFKDGVPAIIAAPTIPAGQTAAGDDWTCRVVANDGTLDSLPGEDTVTVGNQLPSVATATLAPSPAYETSTLTCTGTGWQDADGDPAGYQVAWLVDGNLLPGLASPTLSGTWFDRDETVQCELTPDDGVDLGAPVLSNVVTISNSPPTAPTVSVSPVAPADIDDDIVCTVVTDATDPDGDPFVYVVNWYVDGTHDTAWDGAWTVPAAATELGELWECQVVADDLEDEGPSGNDDTLVLPDAGDFVISEFMATPAAVTDPAGEWVELYNASGSTMNLRGFELHDDGTDSHFINADIVLPPGARVVLARNGSFNTNGGVYSAYEYSGFVLGDSSDQIVLSFDGAEIDRFNYNLANYSPSLDGRALALDPGLGDPDSLLNNAGTNWCGSSNPLIAPGSDFGTPGGSNDPCACYFSDNDGDGYGTDPSCGYPDCNDNSVAFSPAAVDICENGIDENCNGADAICPCAQTDSDGDGWGDGLACNPSDCNDANPFIYPGAPELCNGIDEDCVGGIDNNNGNPAFCPLVDRATATACSSATCYVVSCQGGYYDVDGIYSNSSINPNGCECADDASADSCTGANSGTSNVGNIAVGATAVVRTGKLPLGGAQEDWYRVNFSNSGRPGGNTPYIDFQSNPGGSYRFDVQYSCGTNVCTNRDSWSFADNQATGGPNQWNYNPVAWPTQVYVRVYRVSGGVTCENYQIRFAR